MQVDAKEKVLQALKDSLEPMKGGEIAAATGLDAKEVDKAIKALKKEELINSPKRCYYDAV